MNKPDTQPDASEQRSPTMESDRTRNTPGTDMQAEDAGTASSGSDTGASRPAAEKAMKQEQKTPGESGSGRR
jgi:hypothetical protein